MTVENLRGQVEEFGRVKLAVSQIENVQEILDLINAESDLEAKLSSDTDFIIVTKY